MLKTIKTALNLNKIFLLENDHIIWNTCGGNNTDKMTT